MLSQNQHFKKTLKQNVGSPSNFLNLLSNTLHHECLFSLQLLKKQKIESFFYEKKYP